MKRIVFSFLLLFYSTCLFCQEIYLGLRDNNYTQIHFKSNKNIIVGYEQSILSVDFKEQNGCLYTGYNRRFNNLAVNGLLYYKTEYSQRWNTYGVLISSIWDYNKFGISLSINPNRDSGLGFQFNYNIDAFYELWKKKRSDNETIDLSISYGNLPEFRDNNKNVRVGLKFTNGNLWVKPQICMPEISSSNYKYQQVRVLCSLGYMINL